VRALRVCLTVVFLLVAGSTAASASSILDGWAFNLDGLFAPFGQEGPTTAANFPAAVNASGFDAGTIDVPNGLASGTGTGTLVVTVFGTGSHSITTWFDTHLTDGNGNYWYANEFGGTLGTQPTGTVWQIDEPGYGACDTSFTDCYTGSAFHDVANNTLSSTNKMAEQNPAVTLTDVSLAMGQQFAISNPRQYALVTFRTGFLSSAADLPTLSPGFYLTQQSADGPGVYWMSSDVRLEQMPEPNTWLLMFGGVLAIVIGKFGARRSFMRK
jgi:hypothetical protein